MSNQSPWPHAEYDPRTNRNRVSLIRLLLVIGAITVVAAGCHALLAGSLQGAEPGPAVAPSRIIEPGPAPR
ncbi:hypothetical protein [Nocardia sp. BMG51109]|uniref:hypothetical protein n=1 Tax=Nocardia sp. BMG51109 TaxID=1056816 RepID=UPI0004649FEB|nr:hypothetical protein [Nocardia sp. BMG51109]